MSFPQNKRKRVEPQGNGKQQRLQCASCEWEHSPWLFCALSLESWKLVEITVVENVQELRSHHRPAHCSKVALPSWWRNFPEVQPEHLKPQLVDVASSCHYQEEPGSVVFTTLPWTARPNIGCSISGVSSPVLCPKGQSISLICWPHFS